MIVHNMVLGEWNNIESNLRFIFVFSVTKIVFQMSFTKYENVAALINCENYFTWAG